MKIYIVHENAIPEEKYFHDIADEEIERMYEEDNTWIVRYDSVEELSANWNTDETFYPSSSYMRVINN